MRGTVQYERYMIVEKRICMTRQLPANAEALTHEGIHIVVREVIMAAKVVLHAVATKD